MAADVEEPYTGISPIVSPVRCHWPRDLAFAVSADVFEVTGPQHEASVRVRDRGGVSLGADRRCNAAYGPPIASSTMRACAPAWAAA